MKKSILILVVLISASAFVPGISFGQTPPEILAQQLNLEQGCTTEMYMADRFWTPIRIVVGHQPTGKVDVSAAPSNKDSRVDYSVSEDNRQIYINTNSTDDRMVIKIKIHYDTKPQDTPRPVTFDFYSNNEEFGQQLDYQTDFDYCKILVFSSHPPPHFPTREDIIGKAGVKAFDTMGEIAPTLDKTNHEIVSLALVIIITSCTLGAIVVAFFIIIRADKNRLANTYNLTSRALKVMEESALNIKDMFNMLLIETQRSEKSSSTLIEFLKKEIGFAMNDFMMFLETYKKQLPEKVIEIRKKEDECIIIPKPEVKKEDKNEFVPLDKFQVAETKDEVKKPGTGLFSQTKEMVTEKIIEAKTIVEDQIEKITKKDEPRTMESVEKQWREKKLTKEEYRKAYEQMNSDYKKNPTEDLYFDLKALHNILVGMK